MPSERVNFIKVKRGQKTWNIDPEEVRAREGVLGDDGIRRHYHVVGEDKLDLGATIQRWVARGYTYRKVDNGMRIEFSMPQEQWLQVEKAQHAQALRRHETQRDNSMASDGITAGLERLGSMKLEEFAAIDEDSLEAV